MIYIMDSAVIPVGNYGEYEYFPADVGDFAAAIREDRDSWTSRIGCQYHIDMIEEWTGVCVQLSHAETTFQDGDYAMLIRRKNGVENAALDGSPLNESPDDWEFGWVRFRA